MTELPHLNPVELECGTEDARLWKRVRTLESSLGYSNLAIEGFLSRQSLQRERSRHWQANSFDPCTRYRKRRIPTAGPSTAHGSSPPIDLLNNKSTPALSLPPEEPSAPPWKQLASQCTATGHRSLPRLPGSPKETESNRALERSRENSTTAKLGPEKNMDGQRLMTIRQSQHIGVDSPRNRTLPERLSKAHRHMSYLVQDQPLVGPDGVHGREADSEWDVSTRAYDVSDAVEGVAGVALIAQEAGEVPSDSQTDEQPQEPRSFNVRTLPSARKLRTARTGRCRSLVSPNNKVFSSTVVAQVKLGLQDGDGGKRPKVLIVGSGTFNPIHKVHIRRFHLARNFLQVQKGMRVVGGIVSPSHPTLVRQRHRVRAAEIIPPKHRLSMARAAVGEGSWLAVDPWEVTRKRIMDYMSVLEHAKEVCHETFPGHVGNITILYMCQPSQIHHLNPVMLRAGGFGVITVCRPLEKERLLKELSPNFRNIAILVEDSTILSAELERTSSNMDTAFMFDEEDKKDRPYHNLPRLYMRRASQMPLQM
ncbi:unnamed protein product [Pylaiella littoralis]